MRNEISVDIDKLTQICLTTYRSYEKREGIFREGRERYLPQFNLPEELERDLQRGEEASLQDAANYLFLLGSMEIRARTIVNIRNGRKFWANENTRWIVNPREVAEKNETEIWNACQSFFRYTMNDFPTNYLENSRALVERYNGDPRKTIENLTSHKARENLKQFKGIGRGIANLIMIYFMERDLAFPVDPRNALLKVDIHKSRIPLNTDCVNLNGNDSVRRDLLVPILEQAYWKICDNNNLDPLVLDSLLWIVGSEICRVGDYEKCLESCPIEESCVSCVPEDEKRGTFLIQENGIRVETRERAKKNSNIAHQGYIPQAVRFIPRSAKKKIQKKLEESFPLENNLEENQLSMSFDA